MAAAVTPNGWEVVDQERSAEAARAIEQAEDLRKDFRDRDDLYETIDTILFNQYAIQIPEAYAKTAIQAYSPYPLQIANNVAAALSVNPASVQFRPTAFGDAPQQNATAREHFFEASWERQQDESRRRLLRLFLYSLVSKGEGILKTVERKKAAWSTYYQMSQQLMSELVHEYYDDDARDRIYHATTEDYKLSYPYPIATTDVPPETFYYSLNENGFTSCVEIKQLPYYECLQRFGAGIDDRGKILAPPEDWTSLDAKDLGLARAEFSRTTRRLDRQTVTCVETWDYRTQTITLIGPGDIGSRSGSLGNGTLVRTLKHRYGDPILKTLKGPYFHALGTTTASRLPERAGLSVLYGYLDLFLLHSALLTMRANSAFMTGFPAFKRTQPTGVIAGLPDAQLAYGRDKRETPDQIKPGEVYPFDVAAIEMPRSGEEFKAFLDSVEGFLHMPMPDVVRGVIASDQSGYAVNQAAHMARLAWDPIVANAQAALGQRTGFESWLIENCIREKVYAWGEQQAKGRSKQSPTRAGWLNVGPDDLAGIHHYKVRLDPETPSNRVIETRATIEQMNARLISYEDAVTEMGSNPDEVELSWMTQDYKKSPQMQALVQQMITQKVGTIIQQKLAATGLSLADLTGQSQGTPPGLPTPNLNQAGAPPPNPVPMPGQGLPIAPPPPGGGGPGMPPGGIPGLPPGPVPGAPMVPGVPANNIPLPGQGGIRAMARGGLVTRPTLALIGEAGPEAVVPLSPEPAGGWDAIAGDQRTGIPPDVLPRSGWSDIPGQEQANATYPGNALPGGWYTNGIPIRYDTPGQVPPVSGQARDRWAQTAPGQAQVGQGPSNFVASLRPLAAQAEQQTGIPADLYLAMAANETGWGRSETAQQNNLFSIQGSGANGQRWASYQSPLESFQDFAQLLQGNPRYAAAWAVRDNPPQFLSELRKAGYVADEPGYPAAAWVNQVASIYRDLAQQTSRGA